MKLTSVPRFTLRHMRAAEKAAARLDDQLLAARDEMSAEGKRRVDAIRSALVTQGFDVGSEIAALVADLEAEAAVGGKAQRHG